MNAHHVGQSKQTRIRWTKEERQAFVAKGASLMLERPNDKQLEILRRAMNALPGARRRDVPSVAIFQKEMGLITKQANTLRRNPISTASKLQQDEANAAPNVKVNEQSLGYSQALGGQVLDFFKVVIAKQLSESLPQALNDLSQQGGSLQAAEVRQQFAALSQKLDKLEGLLIHIAKEFGVKMPQADAGKETQPQPVGEQSTEPIHDASQSFGSKVLNKPSILVIGTNGSQPANIKKAFDKDEVSLTFAKAGSRKALGSGDRPDRVVIWKKFVGHRDTQANPNAVVVDGGLGQVIQAIRNLVSNYHAE